MVSFLAALVLLALAAAVVIWTRKRKRAQPTGDPAAPADVPASTANGRVRPTTPPAPMTGLESALAQTKDRSGRSFQERLDLTRPTDDLPTGDDSGPKLGQALDNLINADDEQAPPAPTATDQGG